MAHPEDPRRRTVQARQHRIADGWWWLSTESLTVGVEVVDGVITQAPPIAAGFIGKPAGNLNRWLMKQQGFIWQRMR